MTMLFVQLWILLLVAFAVGSLVAYVALRAVTPPVEEIDTEGERR